jgi:predicted esterase
MSTGKNDTIATPDHAEGVMESLQSNGVRNIRFELHDGGHAHNQQHFVESLKWFAEPEK